METLQSTAIRFRDAGIENIKKYCKENNCEKDFEEIQNYYMRQADEFNVKLPVDFYQSFYNETLKLNN